MESKDAGLQAQLERWRAGEAGAVDLLVSQNQTWILACVRDLIGRDLRLRFDSGDVQNDVNVRVLGALRRLEPGLIRDSQHFRNWLRLKVKQTIWDLHASFHGHPTPSLGSQGDGTDVPCSTHHDPAFAAMSHEANGAALAAIALLAEDDQSLITLRLFEQLSFEDLGLQLGIQPSAADTRYRRAVARFTDVFARLRRG